jgi:hypothetical protein
MEVTSDGESGQQPPPTRRAHWSWRRRLWVGGIAVALALTASCVGCVRVGLSPREEGASYFERLVASLGADWGPDVLIAAASPEFLQTMPAEKVRTFVAGGLVVLTSHYQDCEFERGPGRFTVSLIRRDGSWSVLTMGSQCGRADRTGALGL